MSTDNLELRFESQELPLVTYTADETPAVTSEPSNNPVDYFLENQPSASLVLLSFVAGAIVFNKVSNRTR